MPEALHRAGRGPRLLEHSRAPASSARSRLGLLIAFIPPTPLPLHLTLCALLGILFRLNLPVLFATVFISNPLTWVPQVVGSIWVGAKLMGMDLMPFVHQCGPRNLWTQLGHLWPPLLLGALVLGLAAAGLGYLLAQVRVARARDLSLAPAALPIRRPPRRARPEPHRLESGPGRGARPGAHRGSRSRGWCRARG